MLLLLLPQGRKGAKVGMALGQGLALSHAHNMPLRGVGVGAGGGGRGVVSSPGPSVLLTWVPHPCLQFHGEKLLRAAALH